MADPRFRLPNSFDGEGRPLWKRHSDGKHVYVMCPGDDCGKVNHKSIHGFLAHVRRSHPMASTLLGPGQTNAIEECAISPEQFRKFADHSTDSDLTSSVEREDAPEPVDEDEYDDDDEELQIKDEPVEETGGVDREMEMHGDEVEERTKRWIETSSGSQAGVDPDTVNEHGKHGRSSSSDEEPSKRVKSELIYPKRIVRSRY